LLGQRTVWVDGDPYLATTLDVAVDGNTCCLNLTVGDVSRLQSLDCVVTESDAVTTLGQTATVRAVLAAVLYALRDKHELALLLLCTLAALATTAWTWGQKVAPVVVPSWPRTTRFLRRLPRGWRNAR